MPWYETVALGCAGGVVPDILGIVKARHGKPPAYLKSRFFWISLLVLSIIGGAVSFFTEPAKAIEALSIGYSAPAIAAKLLGSDNPPATIGSVASPVSPLMAGGAGPVRAPVPNIFAPLQKWWSAS